MGITNKKSLKLIYLLLILEWKLYLIGVVKNFYEQMKITSMFTTPYFDIIKTKSLNTRKIEQVNIT